jgi:calcineurin-like phosphoesterase family protein
MPEEVAVLDSGDEDAIQNLRISSESVTRMNEAIIENINVTVGPYDFLYILGDVCFGRHDDYYGLVRYYRQRIDCLTVVILIGNHDQRSITNLFTESYDLVQICVNKQKIVLCHYPLLSWNGSFRNKSIHLFGHTHGTMGEWISANLCSHRMLDVGVDNAKKLLGEYRPFSFEEVQKILQPKMSNGGLFL